MGEAITIKKHKEVYLEGRLFDWHCDTRAVALPTQIWMSLAPRHKSVFRYPITQLSSPVIEIVDVDLWRAEVKWLIESSSKILQYEEDWDDHGSPPVSKEAFSNATGFLFKFAGWTNEYLNRSIPLPSVAPGPDSSVELYWKIGKVDLIINFPADNLKIATFYGDDQNSTILKGTFPVEKPQLGIFLTLLDG